MVSGYLEDGPDDNLECRHIPWWAHGTSSSTLRQATSSGANQASGSVVARFVSQLEYTLAGLAGLAAFGAFSFFSFGALSFGALSFGALSFGAAAFSFFPSPVVAFAENKAKCCDEGDFSHAKTASGGQMHACRHL